MAAIGKYSNDLVDKFCELIKEGFTIKDACECVHIHPSTFFEWLNDDSKDYLSESYKKASELRFELRKAQIKEKALNAMDTLLDKNVVIETTITKKIIEGVEIVETKTVEKTIMPNAAITIFSMANAFPNDFRRADKEQQQDDNTNDPPAQIEFGD